MSRRQVHLVELIQGPGLSRKATVYWDKEWSEYRVTFYVNGVKQQGADYHTDDKDDAIATAELHAQNAL